NRPCPFFWADFCLVFYPGRRTRRAERRPGRGFSGRRNANRSGLRFGGSGVRLLDRGWMSLRRCSAGSPEMLAAPGDQVGIANRYLENLLAVDAADIDAPAHPVIGAVDFQ